MSTEELKLVVGLRTRTRKGDGTVVASAKTWDGFPLQTCGQTKEQALQLLNEDAQLLWEYSEHRRVAYNARRKALREQKKPAR